MKSYKGVVLAGVLSFSAFGFAEEKTMQRSDLPPAVEKALQQQLKGATIKGFTTEKENGRVVYEAQLFTDGHTKDIQFDSNGGVQEIEEEVAFDSLPPDVKAGLTARARGAKIAKVESLTRRDKLIAYEAVVDRHGKKSEIQVGPKGEKLQHEV